MYYKVWSKDDRRHVWDYTSFMVETKLKLIDYDNDGNLINYIIYESDEFINDNIFDKYGLNYLLLTDYTTPTISY